MSQETWESVKDKNIDGMELQLALQCAPLIAGLKISNLLNISREDFRKLEDIIKGSHISWCLWMETEYKMTILLYHRQSLADYIRREKVHGLLRELGYQSFIRSCCNYMKTDILHSSSDTFAVCNIQMSY